MSVSIVSEAFVDVIVPTTDVRSGHTYHRKVRLLPGGLSNVANNIARSGVNVNFIGQIGNDVFGSYFKTELLRSGVSDYTIIDQTHSTGLCISMYSADERILVADRGANDYLGIHQMSRNIETLISSDIVYFSGYSLSSDISLDGIVFAMEECSTRKTPIYFNPGAPNLVNTKMLGIISDYVDVLIMNIAEAKMIAKCEDLVSIFDKLKDLTKTTVITLGKRGCVVIDEGCYYQADQPNIVELCPSKHTDDQLNAAFESCTCLNSDRNHTKSLDTTGAGDVFSAGFIIGKLRNMTSVASANYGNWLAADYLCRKNKGYL